MEKLANIDGDSQVFKPAQACKILQVSLRTLWRMIDAEQLPGVVKIGRTIRISKKSLSEMIENGTHKK